MLGREARPHQRKCDQEKGGIQGCADPDTVVEANRTVEQVIEHNRVEDCTYFCGDGFVVRIIGPLKQNAGNKPGRRMEERRGPESVTGGE